MAPTPARSLGGRSPSFVAAWGGMVLVPAFPRAAGCLEDVWGSSDARSVTFSITACWRLV
jgi:hypothetical protein